MCQLSTPGKCFFQKWCPLPGVWWDWWFCSVLWHHQFGVDERRLLELPVWRVVDEECYHQSWGLHPWCHQCNCRKWCFWEVSCRLVHLLGQKGWYREEGWVFVDWEGWFRFIGVLGWVQCQIKGNISDGITDDAEFGWGWFWAKGKSI